MNKELRRALIKIFADKSPQDLNEWTGLPMEECIHIFTILLTDVFIRPNKGNKADARKPTPPRYDGIFFDGVDWLNSL